MNTPKNIEKDLENVRKYQLQNFRAKLERSNHDSNEFVLRITHNKYQWCVVNFLSVEEMEKVAQFLQKKIDKLKKK